MKNEIKTQMTLNADRGPVSVLVDNEAMMQTAVSVFESYDLRDDYGQIVDVEIIDDQGHVEITTDGRFQSIITVSIGLRGEDFFEMFGEVSSVA